MKPLSISGGKGFHSKCHFAPLTIFWGFSFALGHGVSFFGGIQHSAVGRAIDGAVVQQLVVILEFSQEMTSAHSSSLPSCGVF